MTSFRQIEAKAMDQSLRRLHFLIMVQSRSRLSAPPQQMFSLAPSRLRPSDETRNDRSWRRPNISGFQFQGASSSAAECKISSEVGFS